VPEFITIQPDFAAAPAKARNTTSSASGERERQKQQASIAAFEQAQRQVDRAQEELREAEAAERRAMERVASLAARAATASQKDPSDAADRISDVRAIGAIAAALMVVALAALALTRARVKPTFHTPLEVESALGTPVVGVIALTSENEVEQLPEERFEPSSHESLSVVESLES
jgi:hypothetical protein